MSENYEGTREIRFKQYLFPNRQLVYQFIDRPESIAAMADALIVMGFELEIENQMGRIWMSCVHHRFNKAVDRFCMNGPEVGPAVDSMIRQAYQMWGQI